MRLWSIALCLTFLLSFRLLGQSKESFIAEKLFERECGCDKKNLAYWSSKEPFPSFGIGHFIWLPKSPSVAFDSQFPLLLTFLQSSGVKLPDWIDIQGGCPWSSKESFDADERLNELRDLLWQTRLLQATFACKRFETTLKEIELLHPELKNRIERLQMDPRGLYAMIDYCHFKGTGMSSKESYDNRGWGLLQVLMGTDPTSSTPIKSFIGSAEQVLRQRVQHAPIDRHEERFLPGWINRVRSYLKLPVRSLDVASSGNSYKQRSK